MRTRQTSLSGGSVLPSLTIFKQNSLLSPKTICHSLLNSILIFCFPQNFPYGFMNNMLYLEDITTITAKAQHLFKQKIVFI